MAIFYLFNQIATVINNRTNILLTTVIVGYFIESFHFLSDDLIALILFERCLNVGIDNVFIVNNLTACKNNCQDDSCIVQSVVEMHAKFYLCVDIWQTCHFITISHFGLNMTTTVQTSWIELSCDCIYIARIERNKDKHNDRFMCWWLDARFENQAMKMGCLCISMKIAFTAQGILNYS